MNNFESNSRFLAWSIALLLSVLAAGCGGGGGNQDPILGGSGISQNGAGAIPGAPAGAVPPGPTSCVAAVGPTIPTVNSSSPSNGNLSATTSTTGVAGGGKLITATFSLAMNPATINSATAPLTFTIKETISGVNVPGAVTMNAGSTVATFTTAAALSAATQYTATITQAATSGTGTPLSCIYAWTFTTGALATGLAPINMGSADPFGISATAGLSTAISSSTVNGDVLLTPIAFATCNITPVDAFGGIGSCLAVGFPPLINGTVISPLFTGGRNLATIRADLNSAYLSLCPAGVPDAGCSLNGGVVIGAAAAGIGGLPGAPCVFNINAGNCFTPGVYTAASSITVTGDLTLDAQGDSNAVFVFQAGSTVGTAAGAAGGIPGTFARIRLINGAKASNVWWLAGSSATVGTFGEFHGNILAANSVTLNQGATSCGRMHAGAWAGGGGAITLGGANVIAVPGQPFAPPAGYSTTCQ